MQKRDLNKAALLKSHPRTDMSPKTRNTSAERPPPEEHLWGTASTCQKNFKRLNLQKVFIYSC